MKRTRPKSLGVERGGGRKEDREVEREESDGERERKRWSEGERDGVKEREMEWREREME